MNWIAFCIIYLPGLPVSVWAIRKWIDGLPRRDDGSIIPADLAGTAFFFFFLVIGAWMIVAAISLFIALGHGLVLLVDADSRRARRVRQRRKKLSK